MEDDAEHGTVADGFRKDSRNKGDMNECRETVLQDSGLNLGCSNENGDRDRVEKHLKCRKARYSAYWK